MSQDIHAIIRSNDLEGLKEFILSNGDLNTKDKLFRTPLHMAAWYGHLEQLKLLLVSQINFTETAQDDFNVFHFAVQSKNTSENIIECLKLLINYSNDNKLLNSKIKKSKRNILHLAVLKDDTKLVQFLLDNGIEPNVRTLKGENCFDLAKSEDMKTLLNDFKLKRENQNKLANIEENKEENIEENKEENKEEIIENKRSNQDIINENENEQKKIKLNDE